MPTLADILLGASPDGTAGQPGTDRLVAACVQLIEQHVARRGGLKGLALKAGLSMTTAARPDILPRAMARLLPEFAVALDPLYQKFMLGNTSDFAAFLVAHRKSATTALLDVADRKISESPNAAAKSVYARLRGGAEAEVDAMLPALAAVLSARIAEA